MAQHPTDRALAELSLLMMTAHLRLVIELGKLAQKTLAEYHEGMAQTQRMRAQAKHAQVLANLERMRHESN